MTRAQTGLDNDTAQPSLNSGFAAVMEQEHDLRSWTAECLDGADLTPGDALERLLRDQHERLRLNAELLAQRYESLPAPARIRDSAGLRPPATNSQRGSALPEPAGPLSELAAQHRDILEKIHALKAQRPDGLRGELILTEVARHHEEMASTLTAWLKDESTARNRELPPVEAN